MCMAALVPHYISGSRTGGEPVPHPRLGATALSLAAWIDDRVSLMMFETYLVKASLLNRSKVKKPRKGSTSCVRAYMPALTSTQIRPTVRTPSSRSAAADVRSHRRETGCRPAACFTRASSIPCPRWLQCPWSQWLQTGPDHAVPWHRRQATAARRGTATTSSLLSPSRREKSWSHQPRFAIFRQHAVRRQS